MSAQASQRLSERHDSVEATLRQPHHQSFAKVLGESRHGRQRTEEPVLIHAVIHTPSAHSRTHGLRGAVATKSRSILAGTKSDCYASTLTPWHEPDWRARQVTAVRRPRKASSSCRAQRGAGSSDDPAVSCPLILWVHRCSLTPGDQVENAAAARRCAGRCIQRPRASPLPPAQLDTHYAVRDSSTTPPHLVTMGHHKERSSLSIRSVSPCVRLTWEPRLLFQLQSHAQTVIHDLIART